MGTETIWFCPHCGNASVYDCGDGFYQCDICGFSTDLGELLDSGSNPA